MNRVVRASILVVSVVALAVAAHGQGRQGGGGPPGPPAPGGRGGGRPAAQTPPRPLIADARPVRSCESLAQVALPNTTIESAAVDPNNPDICRVTAIVTHPPAPDRIVVWTGLPMSNWNGRFLGTGGGGFSGGSAGGVTQPVGLGFAAGATDTGHEGGSGSFALDTNNRLNWQAIRNNAHVGIHEMTVTGKALTEAMYGVAPRYSYIRLYMAPGVAHCAGGPGPAPTGQLEALMAWVEEGRAPDTLLAVRRDQSGALVRSRPLCTYPLVARYTGTGSTDDAANFVCSTGSSRESNEYVSNFG